MAERVNDQVGATPVETTDRGLFDFKHKDAEGKPIKEETLASEFDQRDQASDPVEAEYQDELKKKYGATPEEAEYKDEENKHGAISVDTPPGHKDEVAEKPHVQEEVYSELKKPHVQEEVYSEPPQTEEDPEKKGILGKIKKKLPGHNKTDDSHDEAVPVSVEPAVKGEEEDKKGFMDKIKDKVPGLCSSKASDEMDDHVDNK